MPLPDPYVDEPVSELDPEIYKLWLQARENADGWTREANRLKQRLIDQVGEASAGTVHGEKVIYYRYTDAWAVARLVKENPDLAQHYMVTREEEVFDFEQFRRVHRDIADRYRTRSFRSAG
jgi:hypothetical protein